MLGAYLDAVMARAVIIPPSPEGEYWVGKIPCMPGVWAFWPDEEGCKSALRESLGDWILRWVRCGDQIPVIDGIDLNLYGTEQDPGVIHLSERDCEALIDARIDPAIINEPLRTIVQRYKHQIKHS